MSFIRAVRVLEGFNQETLGKQVGKSQSWVSRVESGKLLPEREEAERIAEVLRIDSEKLFDTYRV